MAERSPLRTRARRAYELSRAALAGQTALLVLPMIALSLAICKKPALTLGAGAALLVSVAAMRMRGRAYGRASLQGLFAGSAPLLLPLALRASGHCCIGDACWSMCMLGCITGGGLAGALIGVAAAKEREQPAAFLLSATLIAGLAGMLGCTMAGSAGIFGMAIAIAASSLPVALATRTAQS